MSYAEILLIEDSDYDAEIILHTFRKNGSLTHIKWLRDSADALDFLFCRGLHEGRNPCTPRLLLLDLKMPRVNGLEVLEIIKQDQNLRRIPVVMLSSSAEERDLMRSYQLGVNSYVVKNVDFECFSSDLLALGNYWLQINRTSL
jgi:two-component system, response regulator